jgi:hypothetical protein
MYQDNNTYYPYQFNQDRVNYFYPRRRRRNYGFGLGLPFLLGATLSPYIYGYRPYYPPYYPPYYYY